MVNVIVDMDGRIQCIELGTTGAGEYFNPGVANLEPGRSFKISGYLQLRDLYTPANPDGDPDRLAGAVVVYGPIVTHGAGFVVGSRGGVVETTISTVLIPLTDETRDAVVESRA